MGLSDIQNELPSRGVARLCQESIVYRLFGRWSIGNWRPFDDHVKALQSRPLGMFIYNLRAMFLGVSTIFLVIVGVLVYKLPSTESMSRTIWVLSVCLTADIGITLLLHKVFIRRLNTWIASSSSDEFPPLFDHYFLLDFLIVAAMVIVGRIWSLPLNAFTLLLFANTVVYSTYISIRTEKVINKLIIGVIVLQVIATLFIFLALSKPVEEPYWFHTTLDIAPLIAMSSVTVFSVIMISLLRTTEHEITKHRLSLLGIYERILSEHITKSPSDNKEEDIADYSERQFREQATKVLGYLCQLKPPFWYQSACLLFVETHLDRGDVFLPGPSVNFKEASTFKHGIEDPKGFLKEEGSEFILIHSMKRLSEKEKESLPKFRLDVDAPAAFIALRRRGRRVGVLALYGEENGPPLMREEEAFLKALGSILSNTMEQWEGRYRALPHKEMDELFSCRSLADEVFPKAAKILKKYLEAEGCMVVFRHDPKDSEMEVVAAEGLSNPIRKVKYHVGEGQTGKCAETGELIRRDYVPNHLEKFDPQRLKMLSKARGKKIVSWMAIPIGDGVDELNFGVIKVVNSTFRCSWFTDYDEELGKDLARRLHIIIEKFLYIKRIEEHIEQIKQINKEVKLNADNALVEKEKADKLANERQNDLMIITHQLQGPLSSVVTAISNMEHKLSKKGNPEERLNYTHSRLKYIHGLVEDALALCFGTFSTFGREAGRETFFGTADFGAAEIDAPTELRNLCERLQSTNARPHLTFKYEVEAGFPVLRMDERVFTSVFYSLIHNAMKYADPHSYVTLYCSFERATGEAALKVKSIGEPILPEEKERIFEKYQRGSVMAKTGRRHSGVGLGLWVARELMRAIGGDLTVELSAEHPEVSVFVVHVPKAGA